MKYLSLILACCIMTGCTTVNVYNDSEPVIIIKKHQSAVNPDSPFERRRN